MKFGSLVKSPKRPSSVIPVKTGIQVIQEVLDFRLRGSDDCGAFCKDIKFNFYDGFLRRSIFVIRYSAVRF